MSTPRAKRALNMGMSSTPKRMRLAPATRRVYGTKPEMKDRGFAIVHAATTGANLDLTNIANGSGKDERLGAKVKYWNIDVVGTTNGPTRIDVVIPCITNTSPNYTIVDQIDRQEATILGSFFFNPQISGVSDVFHWNLRLPLGVVSKWDGTAGSTIQRNQIILRTTTSGTYTVNGNARVSYTDF